MERVIEEEEEEILKEKRIFIGGLGDKVTEDDLHKTFSSLGAIKAVEIVRTNGRSFAYINFQPSSSKSLPKLFSSYNGCVWKGGRLRLEIAKEHYMVRLKREWEEDAELSNKTTEQTEDELEEAVDESKDISKKSKLLTLENKQLQIFFPRLRKVKPVPYSGTGKHKYSFQRIEVPRRPIHFCDCEEHYAASEKAQSKHIPDFDFEDEQDGIIDEQEVNMMRSIMDKILKKEDKSSRKEERNDTPVEDTMDSDVLPNDVDNLVINIASGGQASEFGNHLISNIDSTKTRMKVQKESNATILNENEFTSTMPLEKKGPPETSPQKSKASKEQLPRNILWKQKSSWKDLVGESNTTFSISHILPDTSSLKQTTSNSKHQKMSKRVRFEDEVSDVDEDSHPAVNKRWKLRKQAKRESSNSNPPKHHAEEEAVKNKSPEEPVEKEAVKPKSSNSAEEEAVKSNSPEEPAENEAVKPKSSDSVEEEAVKSNSLEEPAENEAVKPKSSNSAEEEAVKSNSPEEPAENEAVKPKSFNSESPKEHAERETVEQKISNSEPPEEAVKEKDGPNEFVIDKVGSSIDVPQSEATDKAKEGGKPSWVQKSPWRDLVGENNSFSISHILPDPTSSKRWKLTSTTTVAAATNPFNNMQQKVSSSGSDVSSFSEKKVSSENLKKEKTETSSSVAVRKVPARDAELGQVCTFMRNAEAEKEWSKLRAAMSGSLKKKSN